MESVNRSGKLVVMIASPLEQEHVERIQQFDPHRIEVLHDPGLLRLPGMWQITTEFREN